MKLSQKHSHLKDKNILLIAAGKQGAVLYKASHGSLEKVFSLQIPKPKYSDNEGIFQKSVHGTVWNGSVEIHNDEPIVRDFLKELKNRMKEIKEENPFTDIYIFAPSNTKNKVGKILPKQWQQKITAVMEGNYYAKEPAFLLDKISKTHEKPFVARKADEQKILTTAERARRVVGGR
jgi:hypothetical protein